jgi:hypothetical protein
VNMDWISRKQFGEAGLTELKSEVKGRCTNVRSGSSSHAVSLTIRAGRFRKHHRPCGQPAVEEGIELFRPLPAQVGHFRRINATPSDLPLTSAGRAIYPVPPQRGQLFGSILPLSC